MESGLDEDVAHEVMAQCLVAAGIPLPKDRESSSSWPICLREQKRVVAAVNAVAPHERVRWVLENEAWDRRGTRPNVPKSIWIPARNDESCPDDGKSRRTDSLEKIAS